jgi:hypothetical protein
MTELTIFSWGYWGWGTSTEQLVQAVDALEAARGFKPPVFVDIRIRRAVRAPGFNSDAFENLLGESRYVHMRSLGNRFVVTRSGRRIQIDDPSAAGLLLNKARDLAQKKQRVIFFCSCEFPYLQGSGYDCHRTTVAGLLLKAAKQQKTKVTVVEWPGDEMRALEISLPATVAQKLKRDAKSIPLGKELPRGDFAWVPPGSIVRINSSLGAFSVAVGSMKYGRNGWSLPIISTPAFVESSKSKQLSDAGWWRRECGFEPRRN